MSQYVYLIALPLLFGACGMDKSPDRVREIPRINVDELRRTDEEKRCERSWKSHQEDTPAGRFVEFKASKVVSLDGVTEAPTAYSKTSKVVESSAEQIVTEATDAGVTTTETETHAAFVAKCLNPTPPGHDGCSTDDVEQGRREAEVPAGKFDCLYLKGTFAKCPTPDATLVLEWWISKGMIKSVSTTTARADGHARVETVTEELVARSW